VAEPRGRMGLGLPLFSFAFCLLGLSNTIGVGSIVEVNRLMKNCRILVVFCQLLFVIWQDVVTVWHNTPCTVCHPTKACLPHWCCWTVLPGGVMQQNILQKWCNFTCLLCA